MESKSLKTKYLCKKNSPVLSMKDKCDIVIVNFKKTICKVQLFQEKFEVHKTNITQTNSDSVIAKIFSNPYNCIFDDLYDEINFS